MKVYEIIERSEPSLKLTFFTVRIAARAVGVDDYYGARNRASSEMARWCEEQFGPRIKNDTGDFESGWWVTADHEFSFSDDVAHWAVAFKMRWM